MRIQVKTNSQSVKTIQTKTVAEQEQFAREVRFGTRFGNLHVNLVKVMNTVKEWDFMEDSAGKDHVS